MIYRDDLASFLNEYLAISNFNDYAPNGLQIEGKQTINLICTAVTASLDAIHRAAQLGADALLVHHGYFWQGEEPVLIGMKRKRISLLMSHDINLFAYHLPLDCHQTLGNNACIGRLLDLKGMASHAVGKTPHLLWSGKVEPQLTSNLFTDKLNKLFKRHPQSVHGTDEKIHHVAWCSGAAQDLIVDAHRLGADTFISGEISERTYYQAKELNMHYFACGHHASECFGIQSLGDLLSQRFHLTHYFLDSDNPV